MRKPRLAVIGGGKFGYMHLKAYKQLENEGKVELVGLADLNESLLEERKKEFNIQVFTNYKEMLEKVSPDGVSIVTPDFLHREISLEVISRGIHVLIEKPLDISCEGCREIINMAESKRILLQVDFHKRYDPYHLEVEKIVKEGKLGEIEYGYAHMEDKIVVPRDWFPKWAPYSSPAWFLGIHMYDLIRWIIKQNGIKVFAYGVKKKLASLGIDTYDSITATIVFEKGSTFSIQTSWILPENFEAIVNQGIRIIGTEGIIEVDSQDRGARGCTSKDGMATYNLGFYQEVKLPDGRIKYSGYGIQSIADFAENLSYLLNGMSLEKLKGRYPDGIDGLEATRIAEGVHKSLETGEVIDLSIL